MVHVNGKDFVIYELDTYQSIIDRIAASLETLPTYLYFSDGFLDKIEDFYNDEDINVEDIIQIISNESEKPKVSVPTIVAKLRELLVQDQQKMLKILYISYLRKTFLKFPALSMLNAYILNYKKRT